MIATILKSSAHFSAVDYNERKVAKGSAELIEVKNFGYLQGTPEFNADNIKQYLIDYSKRNQSIKNTQMHLAISCKGHEFTEEQLVDIAHKWLKEMGYAEKGQPLLIYAHRDTKNTHIHIVTSRVAPDGHKIDHNHERVRSQEVLNNIMGIDNQKEVKNYISEALKYRFSTIGQFRAVLESSGYETYVENESVNIKKDGKVLDSISINMIRPHFAKSDDEEDERKLEELKKRKKQLWAIMMKYRDLSSSKEELAAQLKKSLGISLVFMGSKDSPYGYTVVDHKDKFVFKGSEIMNIKKLLNFDVSKRNPEEISKFINEKMKENPDIDVVSLNKLLWHEYHASISKSSKVKFGTQSFTLSEDITAQLKANNKVAYVQSFHPSTAHDRDLLCEFFHVEPEKVHVDYDYKRTDAETTNYNDTIGKINRVMEGAEQGKARQNLHDESIGVIRDGDSFYCVDMKNKSFVNMQSEGIDTSKLMSMPHVGHAYSRGQSASSSIGRKAADILGNNGTGHDANREWEVGNDSGLDDIDDERRFKR